jgi:hypothetical protein
VTPWTRSGSRNQPGGRVGTKLHDQDALKGRFGDAPAALQHVNVEERSAANRKITVFGLNFNSVKSIAWYLRISSGPS